MSYCTRKCGTTGLMMMIRVSPGSDLIALGVLFHFRRGERPRSTYPSKTQHHAPTTSACTIYMSWHATTTVLLFWKGGLAKQGRARTTARIKLYLCVPVDIGKTSIVAIMVSPFLLMSDEPGGITDVSLVLPCSSTSGITGSLSRWTAQAQ